MCKTFLYPGLKASIERPYNLQSEKPYLFQIGQFFYKMLPSFLPSFLLSKVHSSLIHVVYEHNLKFGQSNV